MNDQVSTFDPQAFLAAQMTDALETEYKPVPKGVYSGITAGIDAPDSMKMQVRQVDLKSGGVSYAFSIGVKIDAPGNELADGKWVRFQSWLDLTPSGGLELGDNKNVRLGQLRQALGQNEPGKPWAFAMLQDQPLKIKVDHDKEGRYAEVAAVANINASLE